MPRPSWRPPVENLLPRCPFEPGKLRRTTVPTDAPSRPTARSAPSWPADGSDPGKAARRSCRRFAGARRPHRRKPWCCCSSPDRHGPGARSHRHRLTPLRGGCWRDARWPGSMPPNMRKGRHLGADPSHLIQLPRLIGVWPGGLAHTDVPRAVTTAYQLRTRSPAIRSTAATTGTR